MFFSPPHPWPFPRSTRVFAFSDQTDPLPPPLKGRTTSCQAAMDNIIYARVYTSEHLEQLLVEAASLMVKDEDRASSEKPVDSVNPSTRRS